MVVPLKYFSTFWKTLDIPLVNCEINFLVVFLLTKDDANLMQQLKSDFKRTNNGNKYR